MIIIISNRSAYLPNKLKPIEYLLQRIAYLIYSCRTQAVLMKGEWIKRKTELNKIDYKEERMKKQFYFSTFFFVDSIKLIRRGCWISSLSLLPSSTVQKMWHVTNRLKMNAFLPLWGRLFSKLGERKMVCNWHCRFVLDGFN